MKTDEILSRLKDTKGIDKDLYEAIVSRLIVLKVVERICSDECAYVEKEFGVDGNKLYIDADATYANSEEKTTVAEWLKELGK